MDTAIKENVSVCLDTTMLLIAPWTAVSFYWDTVKSRVLACLVSMYLQPHFCNGVFGNVYLLALDNTKR